MESQRQLQVQQQVQQRPSLMLTCAQPLKPSWLQVLPVDDDELKPDSSKQPNGHAVHPFDVEQGHTEPAEALRQAALANSLSTAEAITRSGGSGDVEPERFSVQRQQGGMPLSSATSAMNRAEARHA